MAKLSFQDYDYRRTENSVSSINYHFVFVPKRRKAVLVGDIAVRMQSIIFDLVTEHGWRLIALEVMSDVTVHGGVHHAHKRQSLAKQKLWVLCASKYRT